MLPTTMAEEIYKMSFRFEQDPTKELLCLNTDQGLTGSRQQTGYQPSDQQIAWTSYMTVVPGTEGVGGPVAEVCDQYKLSTARAWPSFSGAAYHQP